MLFSRAGDARQQPRRKPSRHDGDPPRHGIKNIRGAAMLMMMLRAGARRRRIDALSARLVCASV